MSEDVILSAHGLHKTYSSGEEELKVLRGVDLEVRTGELVAIVGTSGCGKSTLLNVLGLLDPPDDGELRFEGTDLVHLSDKRRALHRRGDFGFIFQLYHLLRELTALENIELAGRMPVGKRLTAVARRQRSEELLTRVGLGARRWHRPAQLSGGERQRIAIARALFHRPRVLFCDEPTGNLDRETGRKVWELIESMRKEGNMAIVLVTHDEHLAASSDRSLILEDGQLKARS